MTQFITGKTYNNFLLLRQENIGEIHSTIYHFKHKLLGCQVFALKNSDPNKTFCIALATMPQDSTGAAHILEHSVLMGSRKYPVHDVFGEIHKGGLMTFLNAMTGSDTTWYPFATKNMTEYFNIMDVYSDVVFHPLLERTTFEQEGWHFHLETPEDTLEYSGVVFNEMKGAFSDPIRTLFHETYKALLPESTYAHESGGDPACIPDLSFEQFTAFHTSHYHPSNATIFFYGDADLNEELAFLDTKHLSSFTRPVDRVSYTPGTPTTKIVTIEGVYPVHSEQDLSQKTFLAVSSLLGKASDLKINTAFRVMSNLLFNSDASPLKNAILNAGFCRDFGGIFLENSAYASVMMTYLIGSEARHRDAFLELYRDTLAKMVQERLERDLVLSELNKYEFSVREEMNKAQRGLSLISRIIPAVNYGYDPFSAVQLDNIFEQVRKEALEDFYFEHLITERLLNNQQTAIITLQPDPEKLRLNARQEKARLQQVENSLTSEQRTKLVERTQELIKLQTTPTPTEALIKLPRLQVRDLDPDPPVPEAAIQQTGSTSVLINELPTNGISYLDFGLDCTSVPTELLAYLDIFGTIVTEIGTTSKDYIQFTKEINQYTGGLSHSFHAYTRYDVSDNAQPVLWLHLKVLSQNLNRGLELIGEVLADCSLKNRERIREIVQREFAWAEHSVQSEGYSLASAHVFSHFSMAGKFNECINGSNAYLALKHLALDYDNKEQEFLAALKSLQAILFCRRNLTLCITGDKKDISLYLDKIKDILETMKDKPEESPAKTVFPAQVLNQAFLTSAEVVYNVQGCTLFQDRSQYKGSFEVLKTWISRDYLWNTVRQQGGAYGCFIQFSHLTGNFGVVSYRDPQIDRTYAAYDNLQGRIEKLELDSTMLSQLIIGTYGNITPHHGPAAQGAQARNNYLSGITREFRTAIIEQILSCTLAEMKQYAPLFSQFHDKCARATIGNAEKITDADIPFDNVQAL